MLAVRALALAALAITPALAAPPEAAQSAYREGMRHAKSGQVPEAIAQLEQAVRLDPSYAEAWADLGNTQLAANNLGDAVKALETAVKLRADMQVARYNLAYALRKSKQHRRAAEEYRLYLQREPDDPDANYGLAESLRAAGDDLAAAEAYEAYARVEKRPGQTKWIAKASELAQQLRAGAKDAPPPPPTARPARVDNAAARVEVPPPKAAAKAKPEPAKAAGGALHLSFAAKEKAQAPEPAAGDLEAKVAQAKEQQAAAPAKAAPSAHPAVFAAALAALKLGDYEGALPRLEQAAKEAPEDSLVLAALGSAHLGLRHGEAAETAYRRALPKARPEAVPGLWLGIGEALRLLSDSKAASEAYQKAASAEKVSEAVKRMAEQRLAALR